MAKRLTVVMDLDGWRRLATVYFIFITFYSEFVYLKQITITELRLYTINARPIHLSMVLIESFDSFLLAIFIRRPSL